MPFRFFSRRPRLPAPTTPFPPLGPDPLPKDVKRARNGVHLHRVGGAPAWTVEGCWPRASGVVAVRGYTLFRRPIGALEVRLDGKAVARTRPAFTGRDGSGRAKQVFNIWVDLADVPAGRHRLSVHPAGLLGWLHARGRRVIVGPPPAEAAISDGSLPPDLGPDLEGAVAALPSMVRPARRSVLPDPVRSILLVRADQLGDLAISVPAIQRLRALFPDARLTVLLTADNAPFADACGLFDELIVIPFADDPSLGRRALAGDEQHRLAERLRAARFDLAIDLGEGAQSRLLLLLAEARFSFGFRHGDHGWLSASFELNGRDPADGLEVIPPARKLMALVDALGAMRAPPPSVPLPSPPDLSLLQRHGLAPGERYILIHAGARLAYSRWPHMAALMRLLLERTDLPLLVFTHGSEAELPAGLTPDQAGRLRIVPQPLPFGEFDALLAGCAVMVGNDSGPKHLAALRGTKVVSLHMARLNWNEWGQEGDGLILSRRVPCAGCGIGAHPDECGRGFTCLTDIRPEEVCAAVLSLL